MEDEKSARVLVVDDEAAVRDLLAVALGQAGFEVRGVGDGRAALGLLERWEPDVIVLDLMLPEFDGLSLLPMIRVRTKAPIVMLSAKGEPAQRVAGLRRGADDYVAKPFEVEELIARLRTALRRPLIDLPETIAYGDLTIEPATWSVFRGKRKIELSRREFDLLIVFARNVGQVLTRSQLLDLVWGVDRDVEPNTVETYVSYLRAKIDSGEPVKLIRTLRGLGYMMRAER